MKKTRRFASLATAAILAACAVVPCAGGGGAGAGSRWLPAAFEKVSEDSA